MRLFVVWVLSSNAVAGTGMTELSVCDTTKRVVWVAVRRFHLGCLYGEPSWITRKGPSMRYAILYNSASGNTKQVAEALERALRAANAEVACVQIAPGDTCATIDAAGVEGADAVLVGFWCDKGTCTQEVADALAKLGGKRVFLFGTAGFGGAPEYFERILMGVRAKLPEDAEYLGGAMCQGKMGAGVRRRYEAMLAEKPGDARIQGMIDIFDAALSHPDDDDLGRIVQTAKQALGL